MTPATSPAISRLSSTQNLTDEGTFVSLEPLNLEFKHGPKGHEQAYRITCIKQRMDVEKGEEKELNLANLTEEEIESFIAQAKKVMDVMEGLAGKPGNLMSSQSITFHFTHTPDAPPTVIERTLGRVFKDTLGWKEQEMILTSISYKETPGSEERKFEVKLEKYDGESQEKVLNATRPLKRIIRHVASREQTDSKPHTLIKPEPALENPPILTTDLSHLSEDKVPELQSSTSSLPIVQEPEELEERLNGRQGLLN